MDLDSPLLNLSLREKEIVKLLLDGKSSTEIAEGLSISRHTVDTHRRKILKKTGQKNTHELIAFLYRMN